MQLAGKCAFVTGGSHGIGHAIVKAFMTEGAQVASCRRGERPDGLHPHCGWYTLDVSISAEVNAFASVFERGAFNVLVNNAGIQIEKTVTESSDEDWDQVIGTNCKGVFNLCRAFIPRMSGGSIINIGSISGNVADPSMALYNASKSFVHGLTRSIAVDHGPHGIRCNAICPGWTETGMLDAGFDLATSPDRARADAILRHPVNRFGKPEDIAAMAVWLASDEAAFATGQLFTIDGGMTAASPLNPGLF